MVRFELKKIFAKSSNKIALIILLVAIVVISYFAIGSIEYVDSSGNSHTGITAYNRLKEVKNEWKGNITESVLQEVLEENNKIKSSEEYLSKNDNKKTQITMINDDIVKQQYLEKEVMLKNRKIADDRANALKSLLIKNAIASEVFDRNAALQNIKNMLN